MSFLQIVRLQKKCLYRSDEAHLQTHFQTLMNLLNQKITFNNTHKCSNLKFLLVKNLQKHLQTITMVP